VPYFEQQLSLHVLSSSKTRCTKEKGQVFLVFFALYLEKAVEKKRRCKKKKIRTVRSEVSEGPVDKLFWAFQILECTVKKVGLGRVPKKIHYEKLAHSITDAEVTTDVNLTSQLQVF
jgi:hypothetical protein